MQSYRFEDFIVDKPVGQGAYGQIYKATEIATGKVYALKILNIRFLKKEKKQHLPLVEKNAQTRSACPFVAKIYGTFKDDSNLYFLFEYAEHGDLAEAISQLGSLSLEVVRLLSAQTLLAICAVHKANVIHRDVKPENILLNDKNHVLLTDFGDARIIDGDQPGKAELQRSSIVGTPHFVAPELVCDAKISFDSDLWSFGCIIFNCITGKPPFSGETPTEIMHHISNLEFVSEMEIIPAVAKDLITKLLVIEPSARLGHNEVESGYQSIRNHKFFAGVDWDHLEDIQMPVFTPFNKERELSIASPYLQPTEEIEMQGVVERKRLLNWKSRHLVVTSEKRFLLFNIETKKIKTEFIIERGTRVNVAPNGKEWTIIWNHEGKKESQVFRSEPGQASLWAAAIMKLSMK